MLDFSAEGGSAWGKAEPFSRLLTQGMVLKNGAAMSKSRGNIVDPDSIIKKYGADTLRLFILFAAPPETELEWDDKAIEGAFRFLNRIWRILGKQKSAEPTLKLIKKMHRTVKEVTEDIENFKFNTAIASIMELVNEIYQNLNPVRNTEALSRKNKISNGVSPVRDTKAMEMKNEISNGVNIDITEAVETVVLLLSPFAPHICEEMWQKLGNKESILKREWPKYDERFLQEELINIVIQVNGKLRSRIEVPLDISEDKLKELVLADEKLKPWIQNKPLKNFILIPKKLVNLVV